MHRGQTYLTASYSQLRYFCYFLISRRDGENNGFLAGVPLLPPPSRVVSRPNSLPLPFRTPATQARLSQSLEEALIRDLMTGFQRWHCVGVYRLACVQMAPGVFTQAIFRPTCAGHNSSRAIIFAEEKWTILYVRPTRNLRMDQLRHKMLDWKCKQCKCNSVKPKNHRRSLHRKQTDFIS